MDGHLARVMIERGGFVYRWQALDSGYRPTEIAGLLRSRDWRTVRRGAYALGSVVDALDPAGRHVLLVRAVVGNLAGQVVVTHASALAVHGVPLWGVDLAYVHVHREEAHSTRRSARVVHHGGLLPDREVFADGAAQTVGESRARVLLARIGMPPPRLQHPIRDSTGRLLGISDFYIEEFDTAAEFDGRLKYARALYEGSNRLDHGDVGDVVWQEKRREDSFRDDGIEVVRIVWAELDGHDRAVRARFDRAFRRSMRHRRAG